MATTLLSAGLHFVFKTHTHKSHKINERTRKMQISDLLLPNSRQNSSNVQMVLGFRLGVTPLASHIWAHILSQGFGNHKGYYSKMCLCLCVGGGEKGGR